MHSCTDGHENDDFDIKILRDRNN